MMRRLRFLSIVILILGITATAVAEFLPLRTDVLGDQPYTEILRSDDNMVQFEVRIPGVDLLEGTIDGTLYDRIEIAGGGYEYELGAPEVPHITRLIAIPANRGVRVEFEKLAEYTLSDIHLMPAQGDDPADQRINKSPVRYDDAIYSRDAMYPEIDAITGEPAVMRGVRLIPVRINPVRYNPVTEELRIIHRFRVTVSFEGTDLRNNPLQSLRPMSRSWAKLMSSTILNFDDLNVDVVPMGSYLIVCEDNSDLIDNQLPPLIDWKTRKGHDVDILTFSPGANNSTIKGLIQNYYNAAEIPPEFVLLVGDTDGEYALPGWNVGFFPTDQIDHPYSQLEGGDILADVAVGRIPADDAYEMAVMRNKVLFYEMLPYTLNTDWYHQGCVIAGQSGSGISTVQVGRWIKTRMIMNEFTRVDTFWYWMSGSVEQTTDTAINDGISCYNYRGNYMMENFSVSDIDDLTNIFMLPFVVTITCETGGFAGSESYMEHFANVGSPLAPTGAIAAIGTASWETHTRQNNTLSYGTWAGIFEDGLTQAGNALNRGKIELYNAYITNDPGSVEDFSKFAALAGDPGVEIYNQALRYFTCDVPASVSWGENSLSFTVNETGVGPVEEAVVCLYKEDDVHVVGLTDAAGQVTIPLDVGTPGNVKVTVSKHNYSPIRDSLDVIQADVAVGYFDHSIDDDINGSSNGDGDGTINPTEEVEIPLVFKNYGSSVTATTVTVTATLDDPYVTLNDGSESFPNMAPGATANSNDDFDIEVSSDCPDGHLVHLALSVNSTQGTWDGGLDLTVISSDLAVRSAYEAGGSSILPIGSTFDFVLDVGNGGGKNALTPAAVLASDDPFVIINDNTASFSTINAGAAGTCAGNPFNITTADDTPPGRNIEFTVQFTTGSGAYQEEVFTAQVGEKSSTDPQGPDEYGYYCYDNSDVNYAQAPIYDWVEIDPLYGGNGTQLAINDPSENQDMSINMQLPFTFRYYGQDVDDITVCSNGWIAMHADNSYADFRNYPIPSCIGPQGMIAPFWDDLKTDSDSHVFADYDEGNHSFIVQWSRMKKHVPYGYEPQETFQVILFDPAYYPTVTGDGEILFQYYHIEDVGGPSDDNQYSTVGIENWEQRDGLEVVYWNTYDDPAAAHLQDGRAYLFTTNQEYTPGNPGLVIELTYQSGSPVPSGGGNVYFDVYVENVSASALDFDAWLDVEYEGGDPTTVVLRSFTEYQSGWSINRPNMYFPVPGSYAAGNYMMYGRVGTHPDVVWAESGFPFTKSGSDRTEGFIPFKPDYVPDPFSQIDTGDPLSALPDEFEMLGNYPNPFNPASTIAYALPEAAVVKLAVYDVSGRLVATLVNGYLDAGRHEALFDAEGLASGIYLYRFTAGDFHATGKMVLMK